jgi:hypothetical protein
MSRLRSYQVDSFVILLEELEGAAKRKVSGALAAERLYADLGELKKYDKSVSDYKEELNQVVHGLTLSQEKAYVIVLSRGRGGRQRRVNSDFRGLVLGCINVDFCVPYCTPNTHFQRFSRSTRIPLHHSTFF